MFTATPFKVDGQWLNGPSFIPMPWYDRSLHVSLSMLGALVRTTFLLINRPNFLHFFVLCSLSLSWL